MVNLPAPTPQRSLLTVTVFAFNEQDRVTASATSLARQSVRIEALLYDNGSTDRTLQLMRNHALPHWCVYSCEHLALRDSLVEVIELGLRDTSSEYFALLAGDDEWEPELAKNAIRFLEGNPHLSIAFPTAIWREGTDRDMRRLPGLTFDSPLSSRRLFRASLCSYDREIANLIYGVFRRRAFETLREALLACPMQEHGDDVSLAWEILLHHRVGSMPRTEPNSALVRFDKGHDLGKKRLGLSPVASQSPRARMLYNLRFWWKIHLSITRALARRPTTRWWAPVAFVGGIFAELWHVIKIKLGRRGT